MTDTEWEKLLSDLHAVDSDDTGDGLERAVAAATRLESLDDLSRLPELKLLLETNDLFVLESVGVAIANIEGVPALPLLLNALDRGLRELHHDFDGFVFAITQVVSLDPVRAVPLLLKMLESDDERERCDGAWLLGFASGEVPPEPLLRTLSDSNPDVRAAAVGSLCSYKGRLEIYDALIGMLRDSSENVLISAITSLGYYGDQRAIPILDVMRNDPSQRVREFVKYSLECLRKKCD